MTNGDSAALSITLAALREALGDDAVRVGEQIGERSMTDWTRHEPTRAAALLLPRRWRFATRRIKRWCRRAA
jgi:hypothetical protein